jgi:hypothetical protein
MTRLEATKHVPALVQRLYQIVSELEALFPGRPFTPDGHLVGSIGEVLAAAFYDLELLPCSSECHDARSSDGRQVQIKATQGQQVAMRSTCEHLLVLRLLKDGSAEEVYNGPGELAWASAGPLQRNGQRPVRLSTLRRLMKKVPSDRMLQRIDVITPRG